MEILGLPSFRIAANIKGSEDSNKVAILMPGRLDTKDYANFLSHLNFLSIQGFYTLAIDPPGTWDSSGDLSIFTTTNYLKVIHEIIDYFGNRPTLLLGHSRGGATAMLASCNPAVSGVVVVNSALGSPTPPELSDIEDGTLPEYRDLPPGNIRTEKKKRFNLPMDYFEDGVKHDPEGTLARFKGPKLIVHADKDEFETLERVSEVFDRLSEPKTFLKINSTHDYRLYPEAIKAVEDGLGKFLKDYFY